MPLDRKTLHRGSTCGAGAARPVPFRASCLFSKTQTVVGVVVDVATDHLATFFAERANEHPHREFLVFGSRRMTYEQVDREAVALAGSLAGLGLEPGVRLAVDLLNWPEWVGTLLAAEYRDVALVPLDRSLSLHELRYQLRHAEVRAAIVADTAAGADVMELYDELLPALPDLRALVLVGGGDRWLDDRVYRYADLVSKRSSRPAPIAPGDPGNVPLTLLYTSGTMGNPKAVALSHANITPTPPPSRQPVGHTGDDRVLGAVPLFTIFGVHVVAGSITPAAPPPIATSAARGRATRRGTA